MYRKTPRTAQFTVKQRRPLYEITYIKYVKLIREIFVNKYSITALCNVLTQEDGYL